MADGDWLSGVWDEHVRNEFAVKDTSAALATMVPNAYVNHIPVLTGGVGREELFEFYSKYFIPKVRQIRNSCQSLEPSVRIDWWMK